MLGGPAPKAAYTLNTYHVPGKASKCKDSEGLTYNLVVNILRGYLGNQSPEFQQVDRC